MRLLAPTLGLCLLVHWPAYGQAEGEPGVSAPPSSIGPSEADVVLFEQVPSPTQRLDAAVRLYQSGEALQAQGQLAALANDTTYTDEALRQRVRVYLGEVLYLQDHEEEARRVFELVLTSDPDYPMDPFKHPPDVCGFFETIRTYIRPAVSVPEVAKRVPPVPVTGYLGFGIYQLRYGRRDIGITMLIGQATLGLASVVGVAQLLGDRHFDSGDEAKEARLLQVRNLQWGTTALFYGFWGWGILDAGKHWRTTLTVHPPSESKRSPGELGPPGMHLRFDGRFGW